MPSSIKTVGSNASAREGGGAPAGGAPAKAADSRQSAAGRKVQRTAQLPRGKSAMNMDVRRQSDAETTKNETVASMSEVDRELYNIRIRDLEEKLLRANDERRQCEVDTVAAKEQLEKTVTDSSDVIRFLQRSLQSRDDQVQELKERLNGLQLAREQEGSAYENRLETCKDEYEVMEQQLTSEIKLLQGKLTSLEEFRLQKEELMSQFEQLNAELKEKEEQLPRQLERMERQTLLKIESMKESHKAEIESLSDKMEKEALKRLNQASRKALEENTMLLRQVSLLGSNLATTESSLTASKYHNQGLKALLQKTEHKCAELAKQYAAEKQKRKERSEMESMLRDKSSRCDHLERERSKWSTELLQLRQEHNELRQEHGHCRQRIAELSDSLDRCKASLGKAEKESALLSKAVLTAKQMMTAFLTAEREEPSYLNQLMTFLHQDFGV